MKDSDLGSGECGRVQGQELLAELRLAREFVWRAFNKSSITPKAIAAQRNAGHRLDQIDRVIARATK